MKLIWTKKFHAANAAERLNTGIVIQAVRYIHKTDLDIQNVKIVILRKENKNEECNY